MKTYTYPITLTSGEVLEADFSWSGAKCPDCPTTVSLEVEYNEMLYQASGEVQRFGDPEETRPKLVELAANLVSQIEKEGEDENAFFSAIGVTVSQQ